MSAAGGADLQVPGAVLHHEVRGSGPLLLVVPGGPQDAGVFADLATHLADDFTVVAYDTRGNSRSAVEDPAELEVDQSVPRHADDAALLLESLGAQDAPAYVFGTSGGGQIALELAARHPHLLRTVLAHEPACLPALDDPTEALASDVAVVECFRRDGVEAAMAMFFGEHGLDDDGPPPDGPEPTPEDLATFERVGANMAYFLGHGLLPLSQHEPDFDALRAGEVSVRVGVGGESAGQVIDEIARAAAGRLGVDPVLFPGDHLGFGPHAAEFAEVLRGALVSAG